MFYMFLSRPSGMVESQGVSRQPGRQGKVDGEFVAFVECKSAGTKLADKHLLQLEGYLLDHHDVQWKLYHIGISRPLPVDLVLRQTCLETLCRGTARAPVLSHQRILRA